LLSARNLTSGRVALLASWFVIVFQFALFLSIGALLFLLYREQGTAPPEPLDRLYPNFVWNRLPPLAAGVVVASILAAAMSNISAALNSLASATIFDLLLPLVGERFPTEQSRLAAS